MSASPRYALTFVYCLELTTKKHEAFYSTLALTFGSSGLVILGVFFYFVKDMKIIIYILIGIQSVLIVVVALFVPESPKYLYEKGELVKFRKAMQTIARFNGKHIDIEEI